MNTKQFSGATIDDVLTQVRGEFGEGAVILETRRVVRGGFGGFFGKVAIEVTAADGMPDDGDDAAMVTPSADEPADQADPDEFLRRLQAHLAPVADAPVAEGIGVGARAYTRGGAAMPADEQERARAIIEAARAAVRDAAGAQETAAREAEAGDDPVGDAAPGADPEPGYPSAGDDPAVDPLAAPAPAVVSRGAGAHDIAAGGDDERSSAPAPSRTGRALPERAGIDDVRRELAVAGVEARRLDTLLDGFGRSIAPFLDAEASTRAAVRDYLAARLPVVRDWRPRRSGHTIAMVGQAGVGKTSVAAKIAGRHHDAGMDVALISAGPGRDGVLEGRARELGVTFVHAADADALAEARRTLSDRDLVVIDTPACAHTCDEGREALGALLAAAAADEVHLVLPAATPACDLGDLQHAFRPLGMNRLTITKLDETRFFGGVLNAPMRIGRPLAYIADGDAVPGAIAPADPRLIAELLLP